MKNKAVSIRISRSSLWLVLVLYVIGAAYLLYFSPLCGRVPRARSYNLIPFRTIYYQLVQPQGPDLFLGNLLGNILLLFPSGCLIGLLAKKERSLFFLVAAGLCCALLIESIQLIFQVGCFDIDDILLNGMGFLWGSRVARRSKIRGE